MSRLLGFLKICLVLTVDYICLYAILNDVLISGIAVGVVAVYAFLGGIISCIKDRAAGGKRLSEYERMSLEIAKNQLAEEIKATTGMNIRRIKLFITPDDDMNATSYGTNRVSVTRGTFNNTDPITLSAVIAHEVGHQLNFDSEFKRSVFASVTMLIGSLSVASFAFVALLFLVCAAFSLFNSWLGAMTFNGIFKAIKWIFNTVQRAIVAVYRALISLISRHAEYRCDRFACRLGYGVQLAHFLALSDNGDEHLTLAEALYRTHPPTHKRIAKIEKLMLESDPSTQLALKF